MGRFRDAWGWIVGDARAGPAPAPDVNAAPHYPGEQVLEVKYSSRRYTRVVITRDRSGCFRVHREQWDDLDWNVGGTPYWSNMDSLATFTDTLDRAHALAQEALGERAET